MLRQLGVPEDHQRIFQSHAAALEEAKRGKGVALAVSFAVARDLAKGRSVRWAARRCTADGRLARADAAGASALAGRGRAAALRHDAARHPGDDPRLGGERRPLQAVHPRHPLELSSPPGRLSHGVQHAGELANVSAGEQRVAVGERGGHRSPPAARSSGAAARGFIQITRCARRRSRAIDRGQLGRRVAVPPVRADDHDRAAHRDSPWCEASSACRFVAIRVPPKRSVTASVACSIATDGRLVREHGRQPGQRGREGEHLGVGAPVRAPASGAGTRRPGPASTG